MNLNELAATKYYNQLCDIADETHSCECGWDEYHDIADGIRLGLRHSDKELFEVEYNIPLSRGEKEEHIFCFIANDEKEVADKINKLPDRINDKQLKKLIEKVKETTKSKVHLYSENCNQLQCNFYNDPESAKKFHNKIVDGFVLHCTDYHAITTYTKRSRRRRHQNENN